jgi:Uncharacterized protein conserved in bacteria (DUF2252)
VRAVHYLYFRQTQGNTYWQLYTKLEFLKSKLVIIFMSDSLTERSHRDIWELIRSFNGERDPKIVSRKYRKMRKNDFAFFRGTCHLFYLENQI